MNRMNIIGVLLIVIGMLSCESDASKNTANGDEKAHKIVNNAIQYMGGDILDNAEVTFDFRDQSLSYYNNNGQFRYTRKFPDTAGHIITDTLTNDDFIRYKDGQKLDLTSKEKSNLKGGVNSVIYYAFLPYHLNDPGVILDYIDQVTIKGKPYEKIKVTFKLEEDGADHNDVYYYFFDPEDYSLDYLSYEFQVDGGGIRFRTGYNERTVNGIIVRDYINYMADPDSIDYSRIEEYYNNDELEELSRIDLKNVEVRKL